MPDRTSWVEDRARDRTGAESAKQRPQHRDACGSMSSQSTCSAVERIDGALVGRERGFVQRFGQRRVRVDRALQVFAARRVLHRQHRFGDQLARHRADDVHAEDLVVVLRGDELDETLRRFHRPRAAAGQEREHARSCRRGPRP